MSDKIELSYDFKSSWLNKQKLHLRNRIKILAIFITFDAYFPTQVTYIILYAWQMDNWTWYKVEE